MSRHILIVEDEQAIADTLIYALQTEGFRTTHCLLGRQGLELATADAVDLMILDIGLPDLNGFDVCRELRRTSELPVLFLTARGDEIDRILGLELGGDDYVVKPFSPREVAVRVRRILQRQQMAPDQASTANASPFEHDPARRAIRYLAQPLELTRYEYDLLATLIGAPGRVFTRAQLMQKIWAHPEHSLERTVDTHIKTVRAKLRAIHPDADPIRTHRGIGYSLEPIANPKGYPNGDPNGDLGR
ncbi:two-component system response regulator CreB [Thiorhodovibrio frisius]|uniref:Response regulator with CheY-like receiver domain and winged-helix DNA-binding domain n=1 Tax=Thiorhodovibrio frisius TaxID=631362 RepID=H8YYU1_9GAMM|nr:two-component system response regulator CreB [Thiorhodovibrio frisius]EIC23617.1 response regulator with CheY-like receiver domain and winged-helix DNA-binding domain [Thiorhodovibrio frisius]WPL23296.1 Transcriptional regulatory protein CreB [Thiorhodovibrio frisius]